MHLSPWPGGSRRLLTRVQFANSVHMAPRSWELIALSLLAGLGFGLAVDRGDLIFVAVFGAACGMAIVGGCNVSREPIGSAVAIRALPDLCLGIGSLEPVARNHPADDLSGKTA
jgi:hypothetical protein